MSKLQVHLKGTENVIFFIVEFGRNFNIPIPMQNQFYQELKSKFPEIYHIEAEKVQKDQQLKSKFPKNYLGFKKDVVFIKIPTNREDYLLDFFNNFKKRHEKKNAKLKHRKQLTVFILEVPCLLEAKFAFEFNNNFSLDELSGNIAKINPKRAEKFEDFLKNFNK